LNVATKKTKQQSHKHILHARHTWTLFLSWPNVFWDFGQFHLLIVKS